MTTYNYDVINGGLKAGEIKVHIEDKSKEMIYYTGGTTNEAFKSEEKNFPNEEQVIHPVESTAELKKTYDNPEDDPDFDPWKLPELNIVTVPWSELTSVGKIKRVVWEYFGKIVLLIGFLYLFICSLDFLSSAFKLIGGKAAGEVFRENELLSNPVAGVVIGVLVTVLVQSSSTSTSIVVSMVGSGLLEVRTAIPIVMGANIGTSVTNTIVAMGHIANRNDFRRAFAGATVHDMFNWLSVIVLLPIEVASGYLYRLSGAIVGSLNLQTNKAAKRDLLKVITKPFTKLVIQVNKDVIEDIAKNKIDPNDESIRIVKHCHDDKIASKWNATGNFTYNVTEETRATCGYLFEDISYSVSDGVIGAILLVLSLVILCICLFCIVKLLSSLLKGSIARSIRKFVNADFPGPAAYFTGYLAILLGAGFTILVQSSSIFTSSITPLVGMGVISLDRMYPLTLGANIGTTTTGLLAALAQSVDDIPDSLQIAFCHLFFNISGILIFYPIPFMRIPIRLAKFLGTETAKYRWFAILYLILMFFIFPAAVFGLSIPGWYVMAAVMIPIAVFFLIILFIKLLQHKAPNALPVILRNWKFLPVWLRSLEPMDRVIGKVIFVCKRNCPCKKKPQKLPEINTSAVNGVPHSTRL